MAGNATIGALRIVLGADTAALEDGLKHAQSRLSAFGRSIAVAGAAIAGALAGAAGGLAVAVGRTVDEMDNLGKTAQKIGIPVEELSRLKFAAELSDVSVESLSKSVIKLSRSMSDAAKDATGEAANAFAAVGVSVTDASGRMKAADVVLGELAAKFARYEDGANKTALAVALFGRAGADMIPLLNQGRAGLADLTAEAAALGLTIDGKAAKAAEDFNDNLKRLTAVKDGLIVRLTTGLVPALASLSEALVKASKDSDLMQTAQEAVNSTFRFFVENGIAAVGIVSQLSTEIKGIIAAAKLLGAGELSQAFETLKTALADSDRIAAATRERIATLWDAPAQEIAAKAPDTAAKIAAPMIQSLKLVDQERAKGVALMAKIEAEQQGIMERFRTPAEQMAMEVQKINDAYARGILTQEQFALASTRMAQKVSESNAIVAASAVGNFAHAFGTLGQMNKKWFIAQKASAIAQATIDTWVGANKALASAPPPFNYIAAAGVVAAGLANVAKITSQQPPSFAMGGSGVVKGPAGIDRAMVAVRASQGELIDVRKNEPGRPHGGVQEIVLRGRSGRELFTGDMLRDLIDSLNASFADGYRLKLAE
jgi:hypothetical protein